MIGYDTEKKKYIGIWADSMINYMWHYEGTVDKAGNKLTLDAEGPSMTGDGKMIQYQDAYEFKDDDTIVATSSMQDKDGKWTVIMKGTAKRRKENERPARTSVDKVNMICRMLAFHAADPVNLSKNKNEAEAFPGDFLTDAKLGKNRSVV